MPLSAPSIGTAVIDDLIDDLQSAISTAATTLNTAIDDYDGTDSTDIDAAAADIQTAAANAKQLIFDAAQAGA